MYEAIQARDDMSPAAYVPSKKLICKMRKQKIDPVPNKVEMRRDGSNQPVVNMRLLERILELHAEKEKTNVEPALLVQWQKEWIADHMNDQGDAFMRVLELSDILNDPDYAKKLYRHLAIAQEAYATSDTLPAPPPPVVELAASHKITKNRIILFWWSMMWQMN